MQTSGATGVPFGAPSEQTNTPKDVTNKGFGVKSPVQFTISNPNQAKKDKIEEARRDFETESARVANRTMKDIEEARLLSENAQSPQRQINDMTKFSVTIKKEPSDTPVAAVTTKEVTATESSVALPLVTVKREDETQPTPVDAEQIVKLTQSTTTITKEEVKGNSIPLKTAATEEKIETVTKKEEPKLTRMQNITQHINKENVITASKIAMIGAAGFYAPGPLFLFAIANTVANKLVPKHMILSNKEVFAGNMIGSAAYAIYDPAGAAAKLGGVAVTVATKAYPYVPTLIEKGASIFSYNITANLPIGI